MHREALNDRALALKPIFVIGAPRSGTTLVGKILGQHSEIYAPGETHYFEDIWSRRQDLGTLMTEPEISAATNRLMTIFQRYNFPDTQQEVDSCLQPADLVQKTLELEGGYGALYTAFTAALAACAGKLRVCDDTPKHLYYVADILKVLPDAKFIGCVRDPRDFLFSYRNYWRRSTESERIKALYHPVMTSMLWRSSAKALLQYTQELGPAKIQLVKYEELVEGPEKVIRHICEFLDLEFENAMLDIETDNSSFEQSSAGIFSTSVGRWRSGLPAEDAWWCQMINQPYMDALSIQAEPVDASAVKLLGTLASTPPAFIRALQANKEKRGPLLGYLTRRVRALVR